jgi:hypothetical protein
VERPGNLCPIPGVGRFSLPYSVATNCGAHSASCPKYIAQSFSEAKRPGRDSNGFPYVMLKVKTPWNYTSIGKLMFMLGCNVNNLPFTKRY